MRDKGYDVIILNFPTITDYTVAVPTPFGTFNYPVKRNEGGDYIERNAFLLVTLIESINAEVIANGSAEKNIVVGPSMGGLITRYALKWMENNGKNHNTRLWVSFDAPHKGANIPIGDQDFLNFFASKAGNKGAKDARDNQVNSVAAKQMLLHHYLGTYDLLNSLPAGAPGFRDRWQTTLDNLGYPTNLRRIALINGAINGTLQGQACQRAFDMKSVFKRRSFFFTIGVIRVAKTSVSFTGSYGSYCEVFDGWAKIWFNTNGRSAAAPASSKSYDIVPGGYSDAQQQIVDQGKGYDPILGGYSFGVGTDTKFSVYQATHSFIPTFSALGMSLSNKDLSASLYSRNLVCSGESPFDTYYGPQTNEEHITLTSASVAWLKGEIDAQPQPPTYNYSSTYVLQLVSGREPLCSGSNIYTVTNIPTGGTVAWQVQPAGTASVSYTGNGSQATVSKLVDGSFTLIATLNFCNHPAMAVVSKAIQTGSIVNVTGTQGSCYGFARTWFLDATPSSGGSNWNWYIDYLGNNSSIYIYSPNFSSTRLDVTGGGTVKLSYTDVCGVAQTAGGPTVYSNCSGKHIYSISPNPARTQITVSTDREVNKMSTFQEFMYAIKITDRFGVVRKSLSYKAGVTSTTIFVADLNAGTYLVSIFNGKEWSSQSLLIQK